MFSNFLFPTCAISGLILFTYITKHYITNKLHTTNQYYTKDNETHYHTLPHNSNIIYVFWNADNKSNYIITDLLQQNHIIQPLYIERYTILKNLELHKLHLIIKQQPHTTNKNILNYLQNIARLKHIQQQELLQLNTQRKIILNQLPEFQHNLLPTYYITTIAKDLEFTTQFINSIKKLNPTHYNGTEFLEQILRFSKNFFNNTNISQHPRILLCHSKDNINIELFYNILANISNIISIELPLKDLHDNEINNLF